MLAVGGPRPLNNVLINEVLKHFGLHDENLLDIHNTLLELISVLPLLFDDLFLVFLDGVHQAISLLEDVLLESGELLDNLLLV